VGGGRSSRAKRRLGTFQGSGERSKRSYSYATTRKGKGEDVVFKNRSHER